MPTLNVEMVLSYGDLTPDTAVPCRTPLSFALTYTEEATKRVRVPASSTDFLVALDTVNAPRFLFVQSIEEDVTIKLTDGVVTDPASIAVAEGSGWIMIACPTGQAVNKLLVTTAASPATGALIHIISFE